MPPVPFNPYESDFTGSAPPPSPPSLTHLLGTDNRGRDVLVRLFYGFRIAILFALALAFAGYALGMAVGAVMGFWGGRIDLFMQRVIEVWATVPFLYLAMIIASVFTPSFFSLLIVMGLFAWTGIASYMRTEVYREKARDYCLAAQAIGCSPARIIFRHLMPNCLVPVISFLPFSIVAGINSLTALDFLGYGLPAPTPSWGELLGQGLGHLTAYWMTASTVFFLVGTLTLINFIGEAVREAFDPRRQV
jgi:microcin C transport system permease protein